MEKICIVCGKKFITNHGKKISCSKECADKRYKQKQKEWREQHDKERKVYMKNYRKQNAEKISNYNKEYRKRNKEKYKKLNKEWCIKNREKKRQIDKRYRQRIKRKVEKVLGKICYFCGAEKNIHYHEIHGKEHNVSTLLYVSKHLENFIPLCKFCHRNMHWFANFNDEQYKKFLKFIKILRNEENEPRNS